jgi:hypothetical protein
MSGNKVFKTYFSSGLEWDCVEGTLRERRETIVALPFGLIIQLVDISPSNGKPDVTVFISKEDLEVQEEV